MGYCYRLIFLKISIESYSNTEYKQNAHGILLGILFSGENTESLNC